VGPSRDDDCLVHGDNSRCWIPDSFHGGRVVAGRPLWSCRRATTAAHCRSANDCSFPTDTETVADRWWWLRASSVVLPLWLVVSTAVTTRSAAVHDRGGCAGLLQLLPVAASPSPPPPPPSPGEVLRPVENTTE
jgi:hypothetical protein